MRKAQSGGVVAGLRGQLAAECRQRHLGAELSPVDRTARDAAKVIARSIAGAGQATILDADTLDGANLGRVLDQDAACIID